MHYKDEPKTLVRGLAILEALSNADASGLKIAQIAAKTQSMKFLIQVVSHTIATN
ncbi:MAG: hypothetical protein ACTH1W_02045 [Advenella sp.]|uniref:hypothetical protein n=1 Tax=Advenella sp. S44 TaxID=1982755 RepID=UPI0013747FB0|nr:hypothetical protein [Advenella sp. S44]